MRIHNKKSSYLIYFTDFFAAFSALILAYFTRFGLFPAPKGIPYFTTYAVAGLVSGITFYFTALYIAPIKQKVSSEFSGIIKITFFQLFIFSTLSFFQRETEFSRLTLAVYLVYLPSIAIALRLMFRKLFVKYLIEPGAENAVIILKNHK